jgi:hypothetical protein
MRRAIRVFSPAFMGASLVIFLVGCNRSPTVGQASSTAASPGAATPDIAPPNVPDALKPSTGEVLATRAAARGVQIYECQSSGEPAAFAWKLVGPDAELLDAGGKRIGKHYAGPTWESADGSKVIGELQQKADAPEGKGIPWLLLKAKSNEGTGAFAKVTSIQRVDTVGGKAPSTPCDAKNPGARQRVAYEATYYFYTGRP